MELYFYTLLIILALFFGSFITLVAMRTVDGESIIYPPSHCDTCGKRLQVGDLIPVVSYTLNRGRCRYCGAKISYLYLLGELLTVVFLLLTYDHFGVVKELLVAIPFMLVLVIVTITDLYKQLIPNKIIFPAYLVFFFLRLFSHHLPILDYIIGFFVGGGILFIVAYLSKGGMGGGDVTLFALIGLVLGWQQVLLTIFLASFLGSLIGGILLLMKLLQRKQGIPFAPFIVTATVIVYLYGEIIWQSYWLLF